MQQKQKAYTNNGPRIPLALQSVFLRGNRGLDVHAPPPVYRKCWWRRPVHLGSSVKVAAGEKQSEQNMAQNRSRKPTTITVKVRIFFFRYI